MEKKYQIKPGDAVESFTLKDHHNKPVNLADFEAKKVLLSFHPFAWTPVCAEQMKSIEQNIDEFHRLNTECLGISIDTVFTKKAWSRDIGIKSFSMLSDFWPHGEIAQKLGIFRENDGISERANIILDENRKVIFTKIYPISQLPDINEILSFIKNIKA